MVDRLNPLPITRQCARLELPRASFYRVPPTIDEEGLLLMSLIDRCHLQFPFYGSRRIRDWLESQGHRVNRKKIQRLMRDRGLTTKYPKRNLSSPNRSHKVCPYLLKNLIIDRLNQVWATDITYIPMSRGFVYLVAILDWFSRKVLSCRLSNILDASFCVEALVEALEKFGESWTPLTTQDLPIFHIRFKPTATVSQKAQSRDNTDVTTADSYVLHSFLL